MRFSIQQTRRNVLGNAAGWLTGSARPIIYAQHAYHSPATASWLLGLLHSMPQQDVWQTLMDVLLLGHQAGVGIPVIPGNADHRPALRLQKLVAHDGLACTSRDYDITLAEVTLKERWAFTAVV